VVVVGQGRRSDGGDVADVDRADARITDRRGKHSVPDDAAGHREQALEVQVGPQEREVHPAVAHVLLDGGVVTQEPDGRVGDAAQLRQHDQPFDAGRTGGIDEVELLALGPFGRRRDEVGAPDALQSGA
jgi:hypothetical protein